MENQNAVNAKQGSKTFLATDRLEAIWDRFGRKLLSNIIKMNLKWFCTDDPASYYKAVQCTVDQCRKGIARKTGCTKEEAQLVALGLSRLRIWSEGFRANKYNFIFTDEKIGSRRSLITRKVDVESLPEMQSSVMQASQNTRFMIEPQIRDWYDSMGEERRELLGITEWQCRAANWLGDREYMLAHFRDDNQRQYMDVHCSPNGDATSKSLVTLAEAEAIDDDGLQIWSANLNQAWGVNLDNCDDIWKNRDELLDSGKHLRTISNALLLMNARDTRETRAIGRTDRSCASGQEQGMFANDETSLRNTNVLWSGQRIDPWMLICGNMLEANPWLRQWLDTQYHRPITKKPGTPSSYDCGEPAAVKALFDDADDMRDDRAIKKAETEDLLAGSKPWVRNAFLAYFSSTNRELTNRNVWDTGSSVVRGVRRGMKLHLPAGAWCSKEAKKAVKKLQDKTSWTVNGYTRHYDPLVYADDIDAATDKTATEQFETEIWHPRYDQTRTVACSLIPLVDRDPKQLLWALPCMCFGPERMAEDWKAYNAPFTLLSNHDETSCNAANLADLPPLNRGGFIFAHFTGMSPLDQVRQQAGMSLTYRGTKITRDQVSTHISS